MGLAFARHTRTSRGDSGRGGTSGTRAAPPATQAVRSPGRPALLYAVLSMAVFALQGSITRPTNISVTEWEALVGSHPHLTPAPSLEGVPGTARRVFAVKAGGRSWATVSVDGDPLAELSLTGSGTLSVRGLGSSTEEHLIEVVRDIATRLGATFCANPQRW